MKTSLIDYLNIEDQARQVFHKHLFEKISTRFLFGTISVVLSLTIILITCIPIALFTWPKISMVLAMWAGVACGLLGFPYFESRMLDKWPTMILLRLMPESTLKKRLTSFSTFLGNEVKSFTVEPEEKPLSDSKESKHRLTVLSFQNFLNHQSL